MPIGYTECAATEQDGPRFDPPTLGREYQRQLREARFREDWAKFDADRKHGGDDSPSNPDQHELYTHIHNSPHTEQLWRQQGIPIQKNLAKKFQKGKYDSNLAPKLWRYFVDNAAKSYAKEYSSGEGDYKNIFSTKNRNELAQHMAKEFEGHLKGGGTKESRHREAATAGFPEQANLAADKAGLKFHKKQAVKHGIDTPEGMAHLELMKTHMGNINKATEKLQKEQAQQQQERQKLQLQQQQNQPVPPPPNPAIPAGSSGMQQPAQAQTSAYGVKGRQNPVPGIPNKKDQPSQDIRQDKPLIRLQQKESALKSFGKKKVREDWAQWDAERKGQGGVKGQDLATPPKAARKPRPRKTRDVWQVQQHTGPQHGWETVHTGSDFKDARDRRREYRQNQPEYPTRIHLGREPVEQKESRSRESRRNDYTDEGIPYMNPAYEPPKRVEGWSANGQVFSPPAQRLKRLVESDKKGATVRESWDGVSRYR